MILVLLLLLVVLSACFVVFVLSFDGELSNVLHHMVCSG